MNLTLIRAKTADGVHLDGSLQRPVARLSPQPNTAWLLVHGTGSNFYSPGVLQTFAEQLVSTGHSVARINTRGHDIISTLSGGAAFESIADCRHDLRAWVDELIRLDFSSVVLVGHSMGGVKAIFSQAHDPHPNVVAVIGISPPRFCHAEWQSSPQAAPFREHFRHATELVQSGRGDELMLVQQPLPLWLSAAGFLAKYGPHDDYDFIPLLPRLTCPTLLIVGTASVESSPAFASVPANWGRVFGFSELAGIESNLQSTLPSRQFRKTEHPTPDDPDRPRLAPSVQLRLVPGANTGYTKHLDAPARLACEWFASVVNEHDGR